MKTSLLKTIKPTLLLVTVILTAISCDKDFVNVESDIRGIENFNTASKVFPIKTYNKKTEAVQTNNLPVNLLGVYNDPNYGSTSASIVSQIVPTDFNPDFGDSPEIISVKLFIPYFSTLTETDATTGNSIYTLDSIFGDATTPYKLTIYRNNFFLRTLDPNSDFEEGQAYYSNTYNTSSASIFEGDVIYPETDFLPSADEILIEEIPVGETEIEEIESRRVPGIYLDLASTASELDYWKNILLDATDVARTELSDSNLFKDYFRGLTFKVDSPTQEGNMAMLNFGNARIDIRYESGATDERERDDYLLDFNGIRFNRLDNLSNFPLLNDGDETNGDDQLLLKGFEGSMTVVELFSGSVLNDDNLQQDALEFFKNKEDKWLINEANLTFYVDQSAINGNTQSEPDRILLFDLENNAPILDYFFDGTDDLTNPINSKIIHAPILIRDSDGKGVRYKFRLTQHLNRILSSDTDNVKLGLYVYNNVNLVATSDLENANEDDTVTFVPQNSVIAPKGTILYGSTNSVPDDVKATLEIFYTESQN